MSRVRQQGARATSVLIWLCAILLVLFIALPLLAIALRVIPADGVGEAIGGPVVEEALRLSLVTSAISLLLTLLGGTPTAWLLARRSFRGRQVIDTLVDLPMVLPPAVAGVALLMAFGRRGVLGPWLDDTFGLQLPFTTAAVVIAQTFVACPFYIRAARAGFESIDRELERVAATLGAGGARTFVSVTVPLALPALLSGAVMAWARALGEFGATIMFAGNFRGRTQTMPLAVYQEMESGRLTNALVLSAILVVLSFTVLFAVKALARVAIGQRPASTGS